MFSPCLSVLPESPRHYLIYMGKFPPAEQRKSVWYSGNACDLQLSARGSTPAHYKFFCFFFSFFFLLSDGVYKIINDLLLFFN